MGKRLRANIVVMLLICMCLFFAVGCRNVDILTEEELGTNGDSHLGDDELSTEIHEKTDSTEKPLQLEENPLLPAVEIGRGDEVYDYSGWIDAITLPDIYVKTNERWERDRDNKEVDSLLIWTDPENDVAEIIYQVAFGLTASPKEAIWDKYGETIEKGGEVEYGKFTSKYLYDAYYCRYKMDGYIYIEIAFWYYPDDLVKVYSDGEDVRFISYRNLENVPDGATMDEASFWKMAQSMYVALSPSGPEPYMPADWADTPPK